MTCEGGLGDLTVSGKRGRVNRAWEPRCGEGLCGETLGDQNITSVAEEAIVGWEEVLVWLWVWVAAVELGLQVLESSRNHRVGNRW